MIFESLKILKLEEATKPRNQETEKPINQEAKKPRTQQKQTPKRSRRHETLKPIDLLVSIEGIPPPLNLPTPSPAPAPLLGDMRELGGHKT